MCNMKEKLMHKYALSSQGAKDMIKAFISVTISDLILMIPVSLVYFLVKDYMGIWQEEADSILPELLLHLY